MSSTKMFQEFGEPNRRTMNINGPRPNSLSINQTSHAIKKNPRPNYFQKQQPVIIYTYSPKIIHADAKDFMALVQNLTGITKRPEDKIVPEKSKGVVAKVEKNGNLDESNTKSSWLMAEENVNDELKYNFADFPLFTPNSSNFFCSPQSSLRSNYDNAVSSFLEVMNGLPEY